jgi:hypothetical protein
MKKQEGQEQFDGVARIVLAVPSAALTCRETRLPPGRVEVRWEIACGPHTVARGCDPEHVQVRLEQEGDRLRLATEEHAPTGTPKPQVRIAVSHAMGIVIEGQVQNGTVELDSSDELDITQNNGTLVLEATRDAPTSLTVLNGSLRAALTIRGGDHTLIVETGTLAVRLLEGSSCRYQARVCTGTISVRSASEETPAPDGLGAQASGTIGQGAGQCDVRVGTGSIALEVP